MKTKDKYADGFFGRPKDLDDERYVLTVSKEAYRALAIFMFVVFSTYAILFGVLTAPPDDRGTVEVCAKVSMCNDNGVCDSNGECWCTVGMYAGDACEYVSVAAVCGVVLISLVFLCFIMAMTNFRKLAIKMKKLNKERKMRMWDLDNVESIES